MRQRADVPDLVRAVAAHEPEYLDPRRVGAVPEADPAEAGAEGAGADVAGVFESK